VDAVGKVQSEKDASHVSLDGLLADAELRSDLPVRCAVADERRDLALTGRELRQLRHPRFWSVGETPQFVNQMIDNPSPDPDLPGLNPGHGLAKKVRPDVREAVAVRSPPKHRDDVIPVDLRGKGHHRGPGTCPAHGADACFDALWWHHRQVQEEKAGSPLEDFGLDQGALPEHMDRRDALEEPTPPAHKSLLPRSDEDRGGIARGFHVSPHDPFGTLSEQPVGQVVNAGKIDGCRSDRSRAVGNRKNFRQQTLKR